MDVHRFVQGHLLSEGQEQQIEQAEKALDAFTDAFNACDLVRMDQALHFPHVMLSGGDAVVWQEPGQHPQDFFIQLRQTGWRKTQYESRKPVWVSKDKVHFLVEYTRRGEQNQELSRHTNLWIVTRKQGQWAVALRSY